MEQHLIPEFKDFKAFTLNDYKTEVKQNGVTTSVLKKKTGSGK